MIELPLNRPWVWFVLASTFWLVLNAIFLTSYPSTYNDEAWLSVKALNFLNNGKFDVPLFGPGIQKNYLPWRSRTIKLAANINIWLCVSRGSQSARRLNSKKTSPVVTPLSGALASGLRCWRHLGDNANGAPCLPP